MSSAPLDPTEPPDPSRPPEATGDDPTADKAQDPASTYRIGHKERDAAIEVLREAAGDGRITVDELDERIEDVQAAKFPIDLDKPLADLTTDLPSRRFRIPTEVARRPAARVPAPRYAVPEDELVLKAAWESEVRRGRWRVPPYIRCEPSMSNVELNFLEVETNLREIEVEIVAGLGSVIIVVPDDWGVNVDMLSQTWGTVKSTVDAVPKGNRPTVVLTGSVGMGTMRARFANYFDRRRIDKR